MEEDNKLMAEFMGFKLWPEDDTKFMIPHFFEHAVPNPMVSGRDYGEWADSYNLKSGESGYCLTADMLRFNDSWDCLMCVVDKVANTYVLSNVKPMVSVIIAEHDCRIQHDPQHAIAFKEEIQDFEDIWEVEDSTIKAVYRALVKFINWHNEQS